MQSRLTSDCHLNNLCSTFKQASETAVLSDSGNALALSSLRPCLSVALSFCPLLLLSTACAILILGAALSLVSRTHCDTDLLLLFLPFD